MSGDYISREAAIKSTWMILEGMGYPRSENRSLEKTVEAVFKSAPAADVVEVVRCRDCMLARKPDRRKSAENRACEGTLICCVGFDHVYPDTDDGLIFIDENFYCAEGKRKDGGQDDV